METQDFRSDFACAALRLDRAITSAGQAGILIYSGPSRWREIVASEPDPDPGRLADDCRRLRERAPSRYARSQLTAMSVFAEQLSGAARDLEDFAGRCLGVTTDWRPEAEFEAAYTLLDRALPRSTGDLRQRLADWRQRHAHRGTQGELEELIRRTIAECLARTRQHVDVPPVDVDVVFDPGAHRGGWDGERATVYINDSAPFNLADLLYVVAHEGFPGHIAESMLATGEERAVRFMVSPSFVVSEGMGLHARGMIFEPGEAQEWLEREVLRPLGVDQDGSDFDAIHDARDALWGVWGNAAILASRGHSGAEVADYLRRWALLSDQEVSWAVDVLSAPGLEFMRPYVMGYHHGWRLVRPWTRRHDHGELLRAWLTEPPLPGDLARSAE